MTVGNRMRCVSRIHFLIYSFLICVHADKAFPTASADIAMAISNDSFGDFPESYTDKYESQAFGNISGIYVLNINHFLYKMTLIL